MNEIWKDIKGYEGYYQVSSKGNIRSFDRYVKTKWGFRFENGRIMKPKLIGRGYYQIMLRKNGGYEQFLIHRLVAEAFLPNPNNLPQVNHKDENKINNMIWVNEDGSIDYNKSNLEWCDYQYNANYGMRNINISNSKTHAS